MSQGEADSLVRKVKLEQLAEWAALVQLEQEVHQDQEVSTELKAELVTMEKQEQEEKMEFLEEMESTE